MERRDHCEDLLTDTEIKAEHHRAHRSEESPKKKSPLIPKDSPFVFGMDAVPINLAAFHFSFEVVILSFTRSGPSNC
jgi:hypothetical protein